jgi:hypothetical protein
VHSQEPWRLNFHCAKSVKKRSRNLACFYGPTQGRWWECQGFLEWLLWQLMFDDFGDFELSVQCVSFWEKYFLRCESSGGFGTKEMLENISTYTHRSCLESLSSFWKEPCEVVKLVFVGFLLLGMSCHSHEATCWLLERKSREKLIPYGP